MPYNAPLIYLAGPITGLSYGGATDWRAHVYRRFQPWGFVTISPMRAKSYLKNESVIGQAYEEYPLSSAEGICLRDYNDVGRADLILVNLLGAQKISVGTVLELGFAAGRGKPIIVAIEPENVHRHPMLPGLKVPDLDTAVECAAAVLSTDHHWQHGNPDIVLERGVGVGGLD